MKISKSIVKELDPIFKPKSLALVGASKEPQKWGNVVLKNLVTRGFKGKIYPVNPNCDEIYGIKCFSSIVDIQDDLECVYIAVPALSVLNILKQCVEKKVKGAIIISGGFAEKDELGKKLEEELVSTARKGAFRILGPNTMGVYSGSTNMNATFTSFAPKPGTIAFVSQSGYFGGQLFSIANSEDIGFSMFVNVGNQSDIQIQEVIAYLGFEEHTKVITLYIEGLKNGEEFIETCREIAKEKPIITYKAGKSTIGSRAAKSHTASLAGNDSIYDAAFKKGGVIRVRESYHLFECGNALTLQPPSKGNRIGIVSCSGGLCVSASDLANELGLSIPTLDEETRLKVRKYLSPHASEPYNPIDTAGDLRSIIYPQIAKILLERKYIDALIVSPTFGLVDSAETLNEELDASKRFGELQKEYGKPMIVSLSNPNIESAKFIKNLGIPIYRTPEQCVRALYSLYEYGQIKYYLR
jgi:acetyltransferase